MVSSSTHLHMPTALSSWPHIASASAFSVLNRTQYGAASRHLSIWNTACMGRRHNGTLVDSGQGWLFWTAVYQTHQMLCPSESLLLEQVVSKGNKHQPHSTSNMGGSSSPPLQLVSLAVCCHHCKLGVIHPSNGRGVFHARASFPIPVT